VKLGAGNWELGIQQINDSTNKQINCIAWPASQTKKNWKIFWN